MSLDVPDIVAFLGLTRLRGVGFHSLRELGDVHGLAARLDTESGAALLTRFGHDGGSPSNRLKQINDLGFDAFRALEDRNIALVAIGDESYPECFLDLGEKARPHWFFYRGDVQLLKQPSVAVVGTRTPDAVGEFLARYSVATVRDLGAIVVSGLARGIDEIAHEWALRSDTRNVSVLGTGLLRMYPAKNESLADRIVKSGGVLISEYAPDADPNKESFVWRNRLQAALSKCVVAPQWKASSGTAHTMRFARQLGRTTINVSPAGIPLPADHGTADHIFVVPSEHEDFQRLLRQSIDGNSPILEKQMNLFGLME